MSRWVTTQFRRVETLWPGPERDVRGCDRPFVACTRCCRRRRCESHAHRRQTVAAFGRCPLPGCRG